MPPDTLQPGDAVRMRGQATIGELVRIQGTKATVFFQSCTIQLSLSQLEKATLQGEGTIPNTPYATKKPLLLNQSLDEYSTFHPALDLHGYTLQDALDTLEQFIDKALLLGHQRLEIIHGKGKGILRREVQAYLKAHTCVKDVITNHPYSGSEGVTIVHLG